MKLLVMTSSGPQITDVTPIPSSDWWIIWGPSSDEPLFRARLAGWGQVRRGDSAAIEPLIPGSAGKGLVSALDAVSGSMAIRHVDDMDEAQSRAEVRPSGIG